MKSVTRDLIRNKRDLLRSKRHLLVLAFSVSRALRYQGDFF
jgi:hypothetical protein